MYAYKIDEEVTFIYDEDCEQDVTMTIPSENVQVDTTDDGFTHVKVSPDALLEFVLSEIIDNWDEE